MPRRSARMVDLALIGALAGAAAGFADGAPTGIEGFDTLLRVVFVGGVAAMAGVARRIAVTVAAAGAFAAAVGGDSFALQSAGAAGVVAMVPGWRHGRWAAVARAASAGIAMNVVLRLDWNAFHGSTALVAAGVAGVLLWGWVATLDDKRRHRVWFGAVVAGGVVVVASLLAGGSALSVRLQLTRAVDDVQAGVDALRSVEQEEALARFERAARRFDRAQSRLTAAWAKPGRLVPVVGQNSRAIEDLVEVGGQLAETAAATTRAADPDKARLEDGRIDVGAIRSLEESLADALAALEAADAAARGVESPWLLPPVRTELDSLRERVADALPDARNAVAAARVAPDLLGGEGPRRYFVAFQNPAETRANGGIIGNYADLRVSDGEIEMTEFGRAGGDLNVATEPESRELIGPEDYVNRYGRFNVQEFWQDVTFSPDFPSVAQVAENLYPQSGGRRVDGVISIDPIGLAALLELTGPVEVPRFEEALTSENTADLLLREQYLEFADDNPERIDFLETAAEAVFDRLTTGSLPGPGRVADVLGPVVREGRLKLHSVHEDEQTFFESVGLADAWPDFRGDFLGVVTQNGSQSKIDVFMERSVRYDAVVDPATGEMRAEVELEVTNNAPSEGLPAYVIGGGVSDPGVNRMYVSIYTPLGFEGASLDGERVLMESERELGRAVYSQYVDVPPGGTATLRVRLSGTVSLPRGAEGREYRLVLGRQPVIEPDAVSVRVRSAEHSLIDEDLDLTEDVTLTGVVRDTE